MAASASPGRTLERVPPVCSSSPGHPPMVGGAPRHVTRRARVTLAAPPASQASYAGQGSRS